jgi:hypothetical protein
MPKIQKTDQDNSYSIPERFHAPRQPDPALPDLPPPAPGGPPNPYSGPVDGQEIAPKGNETK